MPIPYMGGAFPGWTKKRAVKIITQSVVNYKTVETETDITLEIIAQPLPAAILAKKTEDERTWAWSLLKVKGNTILKSGDKVDVGGVWLRIEKSSNWSDAGFTSYEAIEDVV